MPKTPTAESPIGTLSRGLHLLSCVARAGGRIGLGEVAQRAGLHKVTAHRLAGRLVQLGYLERDDEGRLSLGIRVLELGFSYLASLDLRTQALPEMRRLVGEIDASIGLSVIDRNEVVYIERLESSRLQPVLPVGVGARMPLHATAMGKAIMAFLPDAQQEQVLAQIDYVGITRRTPRTAAALAADLRLTRKRGFALSDQEYLESYRGIAAPIFDDAGMPVAALSAGAFASQKTLRELRDVLGPRIVRSSRAISALLGGDRGASRVFQ